MDAPALTGTFETDRERHAAFWAQIETTITALPDKPMRTHAQTERVAELFDIAQVARARFLDRYVELIYDTITDRLARFVRFDDILIQAARIVPGLLPGSDALSADAGKRLADKEGWERQQALFLHHLLRRPKTSRHFYHMMLLPSQEAERLLPRYIAEKRITLPGAKVETHGQTSVVTLKNTRFLNAEDNSTLNGLEIAVDLALLCPDTQLCVLRGAEIESGKYAGRRVFGSGINLTRLYRGEIPYTWYIKREAGFVNKIYRGLAQASVFPDDASGETREKPWLAQIDSFAIGGACQLLLVCDYIVASANAYLSLPARKEGIIPGFANMRMWRFTGDRPARRAIQSQAMYDCASEIGRTICDEIVPADQTTAATQEAARSYLHSGTVSAVANRRAFRLGQETPEQFCAYLAYYAKSQAECHFSDQLISNLEEFWQAAERKE
ncbi:enoyl-CoA hydratase/isomerase family protein [uncultured Tateyamaria sp.]|uniref:enoyl-CoA hydratase/isomerase family protein n=1 Tax=uncultured Tateyamaria sp. TaxID=455651 RepID=UPI002604549A|nr:enoyl-CoA hydratase/isomerase family protein [uncultured Tateyamaria sp.]